MLLGILICITGIFGGNIEIKRFSNHVTHHYPVWRERSGTKGVEVQGSVEVWGSSTLSVHELEGGARSSGSLHRGESPSLGVGTSEIAIYLFFGGGGG